MESFEFEPKLDFYEIALKLIEDNSWEVDPTEDELRKSIYINYPHFDEVSIKSTIAAVRGILQARIYNEDNGTSDDDQKTANFFSNIL